MEYIADNVLIVGTDEFVTKEGVPRYSLLLSNGKGQPHKVGCSPEIMAHAVPIEKRYTVRVNVDTVGYNAYSDIVELIED